MLLDYKDEKSPVGQKPNVWPLLYLGAQAQRMLADEITCKLSHIIYSDTNWPVLSRSFVLHYKLLRHDLDLVA